MCTPRKGDIYEQFSYFADCGGNAGSLFVFYGKQLGTGEDSATKAYKR